MADPVLGIGGDRTLRTVFTHDHFGPSTHQQTGLYAGLVVEPAGSKWRDPETGVYFGSRSDGGPTSWRADILTENDADSFREFLVEFGDFQLAYEKDSHPDLPFGAGPTFPKDWHGVARQPGEGFDRPDYAINPPAKKEADLPVLVQKRNDCPTLDEEDPGVDPDNPPLPCPEAVSADDPGTMVANYRNEPIARRVYDPSTGGQASNDAGDLALAFSSLVDRADNDYDVQPNFYPPLTPNVRPRDPYTPLLQAYEHDKVSVRILVGAHEEGHNFSINGMKWLFEPSWPESGYRNSQMMGISEHFEFETPQLVVNPEVDQTDYLWAAGSSTDDLWNGLWGVFRVFSGAASFTGEEGQKNTKEPDLLKLPNNPEGRQSVLPEEQGMFTGSCPAFAPQRTYKVIAATAKDLIGGPLVYNTRTGPNSHGPLEDPTAIMYVRESDINPFTGKLQPGLEVEPLILRARAGECITVHLTNKIPDDYKDHIGFSSLPMLVEKFNNNDIQPSRRVGLHPQMVFYDVSQHDGNDVGVNAIRTAKPGDTVTYQWYAGDIRVNANGTVTATPIEFGATNLIPADRIKHTAKGAMGALIIEPANATWIEDSDLDSCGSGPYAPRCSHATATVSHGGEYFRELVLLFQSDLNLKCNDCGNDPLDKDVIPNLAEADDSEDSGQKGLNYRTEPMWFRYGYDPEADLGQTRELLLKEILTNSQVGGDPQTPMLMASAGDPVRIRVLSPGGHQRNHVFQVHGHAWQQEPYVNASREIGDQPLSMWEGAKMGHGPTNHFDAVLENGAGGAFGITGDFLYRDHTSFLFDGGLWGLLRVLP